LEPVIRAGAGQRRTREGKVCFDDLHKEIEQKLPLCGLQRCRRYGREVSAQEMS
jgi:hypothetical protein